MHKSNKFQVTISYLHICIQIKDYKGSYKLIQGQVFFSSSELAVPEHKYAVS